MGTGSSQQAQGLHAAYDILEALSPQENDRLDGIIRRLTDHLFSVVIKPQLDAHKNDTYAVSSWSFRELSEGTKGLTGRVTLTKTPTHALEWSSEKKGCATSSSDSPEEISI